MVALRGRDIDSYLARPDSARPIVLLYGPDTGLVRERADALMASAVDDPNDPFSLVRLDGDELAAEPSRLVDEAMTVPLFGGRRAIRVRAGSRSFASGVDTLADSDVKDCRIVIEAGDLRPESPLRKACERAKNAVAIACYPDGERDLARLIDDELRLSNLRIAPDARTTLTSLLGGDRQASRNELRKLTLFAHGDGEVTLDHVMAVVADASELKLDPIVDGAFAGKPELVNEQSLTGSSFTRTATSLATAVACHLKGDAAASTQWAERAAQKGFASLTPEMSKQLLLGATPPTVEQLNTLCADLNELAVLGTWLMVRYPDQREVYEPYVRERLNFRFPPALLIQKVLDQKAGPAVSGN